MSSAYLRLLIFLPAILIPACAFSSPAFSTKNKENIFNLIVQYLEKYSHIVQQLHTKTGTHICIFESLQVESSHVKVFLHLNLGLRVCFWGTQPKTKTKGLVCENILSGYRAWPPTPSNTVCAGAGRKLHLHTPTLWSRSYLGSCLVPIHTWPVDP